MPDQPGFQQFVWADSEPSKRKSARSSAKVMHKRTRTGETTAEPSKRKRKPQTKAVKKQRHVRVRGIKTDATITLREDKSILLVVNDILTKNERHNVIIVGRPKSAGGKGQRAVPVPSDAADAYVKAVSSAARACHGSAFPLETGAYRLDILSVWPTERHHADGTNTANGDSDAPIAMVKDALQHAGVIDDDMRIVCGSDQAVYRKGVRATVAVLRPVSADEHAAAVAPLLALLPC